MDIDEFIRRLSNLSAAEIEALSARVVRVVGDDDLAWWRATIAVDRSVRRLHRSNRSAGAAGAAARAVTTAARRASVDPTTDAVTRLAKAAADAARALVAEDDGVEACYFLDVWASVVELPPWAPCTGQAA